jgi:hypothetical protein
MKIAKFALPVAIILLIGWLINIIYEPIQFEKEKKRRYAQVIQRLKDIRTAQIAFKTVNGSFTADFDSLVSFVKNGQIPVIKQIGNVDDSTAVIIRDTIYVSVLDSLFPISFKPDSLPFVPFTGNAKFTMQAGEIEKGFVKLKVFEVTDSKPFDKSKVLRVGSMTEPTNAGNWE